MIKVIDEKQYKKAFKEVLVILNIIPNEYYDKIPKEIILTLQQFQDEYYEYELEFNKEFREQNVSEISKAILANFYRDYWASNNEKKKIIEKENLQRIKLEDEKRKKYNPEDIFRVSNLKEKQIEDTNSNNSLILMKKENFFQKIIIKIKKIFLK
ncbi:MAG: hypothetical protein HFJ59_01010 [Clostridia bacterium]|nr:hypothetical protein [Clostridia bacterium]